MSDSTSSNVGTDPTDSPTVPFPFPPGHERLGEDLPTRLGRFSFKLETVRNAPRKCILAMTSVLVVQANFNFASGTVEYVAMCDQFEPCQCDESHPPPLYHAIISTNEKGEQIFAWLPESALAKMQPNQSGDTDPPASHQERVMIEKNGLDDKLIRLGEFIETNPKFAELPADEQDRMHAQREAMLSYSGILGERIAAFMAPDSEIIGAADAGPVANFEAAVLDHAGDNQSAEGFQQAAGKVFDEMPPDEQERLLESYSEPGEQAPDAPAPETDFPQEPVSARSVNLNP